jgi:hypothetical protein
VVRFDDVRERAWASAHAQLHAESLAVGFPRAHADKTSETSRLHLPVGGRRFKRALEDVIEFAIVEFNVDKADGHAERVEEGRRHWRRLQVKAVIRDVIKDDPTTAPDELRETIELAAQSVGDSIGEWQGQDLNLRPPGYEPWSRVFGRFRPVPPDPENPL